MSGAAWDSLLLWRGTEKAISFFRFGYFNVIILSTLDLTIIFISAGVVIFPRAFPSLMEASIISLGTSGCSD